MLKVMFLGVNGSLQELHSGNTSFLVLGAKGSAAVDLSCNLAAVVNAGVDAVILTHEHIDHIYGLPSLLHQLWIAGRRKALTIFLPEGMEALADGLIGLFGLRGKKGMFEIRLCTDRVFSIGTMKAALFPTDHTKVSAGLVIEEGGDKLVYTCDTRPIKEAPSCMEGARMLIHEASGVSKDEETLLEKGHSSGADAGALALKLGVERLYLCHLPRGEEAKAEILAEARAVFPDSYIPDVLREIPAGNERGRADVKLFMGNQ